MGAGQRLKSIRELLGLTQSEIGNVLGCKWFKIKDIEAEKQKLPIDMALEIEKKYSISFKWLLTGDGEKFIKPSKEVEGISSEVLEALKSNPTIEKIVIMLGKTRDDDIFQQIFLLLLEKEKVRDLEEQIKTIKEELHKKRGVD